MVDLNVIPNAPIKLVFIVHFILICLGLGKWCPLSYFFYNALFFMLLFWTMHSKEAEEPIQMAVAVNAASIILDILVIALYFPEYYRASDRFSAGMAILNLIIRPVTTLILYRLYAERVNASGGAVPPMFGIATSQRSPYQDIDVVVHQTVPRTEVPSPSPFSPIHNKMPPPDNQMPPPYQS